MRAMQRLPGVLYGAGFALLLVYVLPTFFGVRVAQDSLLLIIGLVMNAVAGIIPILASPKVSKSAENA